LTHFMGSLDTIGDRPIHFWTYSKLKDNKWEPKQILTNGANNEKYMTRITRNVFPKINTKNYGAPISRNGLVKLNANQCEELFTLLDFPKSFF
jgi:hypothetical protein